MQEPQAVWRPSDAELRTAKFDETEIPELTFMYPRIETFPSMVASVLIEQLRPVNPAPETESPRETVEDPAADN